VNKVKRYRLSEEEVLKLGLQTNSSGRYRLTDDLEVQLLSLRGVGNTLPTAWSEEKNRFHTLEEYCEVYGLDFKTVKSAKLVSHNHSHMVYNISFINSEDSAPENLEVGVEEIIKKYISPINLGNTPNKCTPNTFDRLVYTDVHIAMDVAGIGGDPMYYGKWDKEEVFRRLELMINHVLKYQKSKILIIDDLGDFMDGLNKQTTRGGHELPQNMNDKEAFDLALLFKTSLVDSLILHYDKIICNNITNDNHSGLYSHFVSTSVEHILKCRYSERVVVNTIKKFMHHYIMGRHTFILSHGKDKCEIRFSYKPRLDAMQANRIDQYCKEHNLYTGGFIEFSKGDSHQAIYDETTSNDFSYYTHPAFSPPSNWVTTNFTKSRSGFNFYSVAYQENIKISTPYWF
jgi:hypothetical protein